MLSGAVALLEFFLAAARARIVPTDILQRVACRILMGVIAVGAVYMDRFMLMIMIMLAIGAVNMWLIGHCGFTPE